MYCCKATPTAVSDASVMREVGVSRWGYDRRVAFNRASFVALKAASAVSVHTSVCVFGLEDLRRSCNGCMSLAQWGRNLWLKLTIPMNCRNFLCEVGCGKSRTAWTLS